MRASYLQIVVMMAFGFLAPAAKSATHRFVHADGKPAAGAKVTLYLNGPGKPVSKSVWVTDGKGDVEIDVDLMAEEIWRVRPLLIVDAEGAATGIWRGFFNKEEGGTSVLAPAFAEGGRVMTEEGEVVAGAKVRVAYLGNRTYVPVFGEDLKRVPGFETVTDDAGRFRLRGATLNGHRWAPGAEIAVEAEVGGRLHTGLQGRPFVGDTEYFEKPVEGVKREEIGSITIYPTRAVRGKVTDRLTGKPVAGVEVKVWNDRFPDTRTTTDAGGVFEIGRTYLHGGRSIEFTHPDFAEARFREIKPRAAGDGDIEMEVALRPFVEVRGKVLEDATGKPFPTPISLCFEHYEPEASGGWKEWWGRCHHRTEIREDGSFVFLLPVGSCRASVEFTVSKGQSFPFEQEFSMEVQPGGEQVEFRLVRKPPVNRTRRSAAARQA